MSNIYLVRHGEALDDINETFGGWADDPLTQNGLDLAEKLAKKLKSLKVKKIYASPLQRARVTAEIIGKQLDLPVEVITDLKERNRFGALTGMKISEAYDKHPELTEKLNDYLEVLPGAESYQDYRARVLKTFDQLTHIEEDILIVGHNGTFRIVLWELLNRPDFNGANLHAILHLKKDEKGLKLHSSKGLKFTASKSSQK